MCGHQGQIVFMYLSTENHVNHAQDTATESIHHHRHGGTNVPMTLPHLQAWGNAAFVPDEFPQLVHTHPRRRLELELAAKVLACPLIDLSRRIHTICHIHTERERVRERACEHGIAPDHARQSVSQS